MVRTIIMKRALVPLILILRNTFRTMMLSVTRAMDKPKESTIRSMMFTCLKKTSVQAKPGMKNTMTNPNIARRMGNRSKKGKIDPNIWLKSMFYVPFPPRPRCLAI